MCLLIIISKEFLGILLRGRVGTDYNLSLLVLNRIYNFTSNRRFTCKKSVLQVSLLSYYPALWYHPFSGRRIRHPGMLRICFPALNLLCLHPTTGSSCRMIPTMSSWLLRRYRNSLKPSSSAGGNLLGMSKSIVWRKTLFVPRTDIRRVLLEWVFLRRQTQ